MTQPIDTIAVGQKIPQLNFQMKLNDGIKTFSTCDYFKDSRVVLFVVPGAFTPTCSAKHLPGFVAKADEIKAKGVDEIACLASNDAFVLQAWSVSEKADNITMLSDGDLSFVDATGLELDLTGRGLGKRANRFAMIVDNGKVTHLAVEEPGVFEVSSAEAVLEKL